MRYLIYNIWILIVISSCNKNTDGVKTEFKLENEKIIKISYHDNGKVSKTSEYSLDTILDGKTIYYYQNGKQKQIQFYRNNKLQGVDSGFYATGRLAMKANWLDSMYYGEIFYFFNQNPIPYLVINNDDTTIINMPPPQVYMFYGEPNIKQFDRQYDENGRVISTSGNAISSIYYDKEKYKIGDTVNLDLVLALPPLSNWDIKANINHKEYSYTVSPKINTSTNLSSFYFIPNDIGAYEINFIYDHTGLRSIKKLVDTVNYEVLVQP